MRALDEVRALGGAAFLRENDVVLRDLDADIASGFRPRKSELASQLREEVSSALAGLVALVEAFPPSPDRSSFLDLLAGGRSALSECWPAFEAYRRRHAARAARLSLALEESAGIYRGEALHAMVRHEFAKENER